MTPDQAHGAALTVINNILQGQAAMLAYEFIFFWIGLLFALCLPLIFLLRKPAAGWVSSRRAGSPA